ncbi:MAG TPA: hypothetical protein PJ997_01955 [Candidatus Paceibacterota bacterium]|nr:hypothetical protein [Candidatus Paceibacterota bacterium]HMP19079.1 hypothetical protein [Candidatus Paceibacterota bacterium]HMP85471.1 hypothetical protein [Candidatus Paceibacterota bacterium]
MSEKNTKIEIIPTVMPTDQDDFIEKINRVANLVKTIQIDVMDGQFVPSISWPYNSPNDTYWQNLLTQQEGLPAWDKVDFEIDLMVKDQIVEAKNWISAGVSRVICHVEALEKDVSAGPNTNSQEEFFKLKKDFGVELYLALVPTTNISILEKYLENFNDEFVSPEEKIDGVQFMGINKIGFQGQPFESSILESIKILRQKYSNLKISVDGGVNFQTAPLLIDAGVTALASGSLIFNSSDPKEAIEELKNCL